MAGLSLFLQSPSPDMQRLGAFRIQACRYFKGCPYLNRLRTTDRLYFVKSDRID
jgi:hypothetical protein